VEYYLLSHGVVIMAGETALALRMPPTGIWHHGALVWSDVSD
jgi:hypothetical protein